MDELMFIDSAVINVLAPVAAAALIALGACWLHLLASASRVR